MLRKITLFLNDLEYLLDTTYKHPLRKRLVMDYIRLRCKAFLNRWFDFKKEHFLNYTVSFSSYDIFFAIFRQVFVRHTYYFELENESPHIIDCGGNIGMSVLYFKYIFPKSKITVFEPSKEVLPILRENITSNGLNDVILVEKAVSDRNGETLIYPRGAAACGNTLEESISKSASGKKNSAPYTVSTTTLSEYIKESIDLLKLDIEGREGAVMRELDLSKSIQKIQQCVMEYHYYPQDEENDFSELIQILKKNDWQIQLYFEDLPETNLPLSLHGAGSYSLSIRTK